MKPTLIVIIGRRWFDKRAGNTYHDAEIIVHGLDVAGQMIPAAGIIHYRTHMTYGYDDSYVETGAKWLDEQKVISRREYANGGSQPLWQYCQDNGIKLITSVVDVGSRKELKGA